MEGKQTVASVAFALQQQALRACAIAMKAGDATNAKAWVDTAETLGMIRDQEDMRPHLTQDSETE